MSVAKQRQSAHYVLSSGFQLAQALSLLAGMTIPVELMWLLRNVFDGELIASRQKRMRRNFVTPAKAGVQTGSPPRD